VGVDVAGRAVLLQRLQNLADGLAIVIGGAATEARLLNRIKGRTFGSDAGIEAGFVEVYGAGGRCVVGAQIGLTRSVHIERLLNGRESDFGRILGLL
jgi:hypothetical protein